MAAIAIRFEGQAEAKFMNRDQVGIQTLVAVPVLMTIQINVKIQPSGSPSSGNISFFNQTGLDRCELTYNIYRYDI